MEQLVVDRILPRHWAGNNRASYHSVEKKASRVNKSYATPRIKGRHTRGGSASFWSEQRPQAQASDRIVIDMPSISPPTSNHYRPRPVATRMDFDVSGSPSRSSVSTQSSSTRRLSSTAGRGSSNFDSPSAPRYPSSSSAWDRVQSSGASASVAHLDQGALASPMRTLLLTMAPIVDMNSESVATHKAKNTPTEFYTWENLPPQNLVRGCIDAFYGDRGISNLLCPIPEMEALEMFQSIYNVINNNLATRVSRTTNMNYRLCQVLLMATLGSQYLDSVTNEARTALFTSGKWYLDMAFGKDANDLQRFRANILVGLHLIFEKRIVATEYLNRAIAIGLVRGLHRHSPPLQTPTTVTTTTHAQPAPATTSSNRSNVVDIDVEVSDHWVAWKRTWRSLVFIDGWLSTSVGSVPQMFKTFEPISEDCRRLQPAEGGGSHTASGDGGGNSGDLEFDLHAELASLGVLMGAITKDVIQPEIIQLNTVRVYSEHLKAWHANLPEGLTLSTAVRNRYESPQKNSTLLIHCAYLGSITQLTRRLLVETVAAQLAGTPIGGGGGSSVHLNNERGGGRNGGGALAEANATAEEFSKMCVSAARQLATVIGMLRAENRLTRRCWLIIQSAYTAAIVICLDVSSHRGRPMLESAFNESLDLISKCITTLQHCATFDAVSQGYLDILLRIYRTLLIPEPSVAAKRARLYRDPFTGPFGDPVSETYPANEVMLDHILELLKAPYGGESTIIDQDFFSAGGAGNFSEHYRFLPANTRFNMSNGMQLQQAVPYPHYANQYPVLISPTTSRGVRMGNTPMDQPSAPLKYPLRSREEYEAFFRRVT